MTNPGNVQKVPKFFLRVGLIRGPILKFLTYVGKAFWVMLLVGFVILLFIRNQLKFENGAPQNFMSSFWFIYVIILAGVMLLMVISSLLVLLYVRIKLPMIRKYLQVHGKEGEAKIIQLRLLMNTSPLAVRSNHLVDFELEFDHHRVHTLGYLGVSAAHHIPQAGNSVKIFYDPDNVESVVLKDSWIKQKWV